MKRLDDHYEYLADFFSKTAILAEGALIFGQFVPGLTIDWLVFVLGSICTVGFITVGYFLKKKSYHLQKINLP